MELRHTLKGSLFTYPLMLIIAVFAVVMFMQVVPFLFQWGPVNFLSTKTDATLNDTTFKAGFYIHIISSMVVLVAGIPQFLPVLIKRYPAVHRTLGKVYVLGILIFAAESGLILAAYANGGLPAKTGFMLQCLVWWLSTYMAWKKIMEHNYREHIAWMIRSFAITLAAFSLRTETWLLHTFLDTHPLETYVTITWLSWVGNWILAEIMISAGLDKYLLRKLSKPSI